MISPLGEILSLDEQEKVSKEKLTPKVRFFELPSLNIITDEPPNETSLFRFD
ncbi:hypothetical protein GCM10009123_22150 [Kangiella japonica]|uniref:Uncharacterized protein n=1 Tax=Kangiella japonica TaxID=647384 RepID=A0ABN0T7T1_9GAMM